MCLTECILLRLFFNLQGFYDVLRVLIADARSFQDLAISCWLKHLALISCWTINPKPNKMSLDYLKLLYREFQKYLDWCFAGMRVFNHRWKFCEKFSNLIMNFWSNSTCSIFQFWRCLPTRDNVMTINLKKVTDTVRPWLQVVKWSRSPINVTRIPVTLWLNFEIRLWQGIQTLKVSPTLIIKQTKTVTLNRT